MGSDSDNEEKGSCEVCKSAAVRKCSACKLVFYCSEAHQQEHWKEHKIKCRPFEEQNSKELGRYLQSTRELQPGDVIFSELPLVFGPKPHRIQEGPFPCVGCCRLSLYLGVLLNEKFIAQFKLLLTTWNKPNQNLYTNQIKGDILNTLEENKRILMYEQKTNAGHKLIEVVTGNEALFENWRREHGQ
uniref:Uncharacterized protein LOC114340414 n=1 Tax=Diabrotica virgifera virgifera TaxID=50390 RepID=A0A6P7GC47_DIAVI